MHRARLKHRRSKEGMADHRDSERVRRAKREDLSAFVGDQGSNRVHDLANLAAMKAELMFSRPLNRGVPRQCMVCGRSGEESC